MGNLLIARAWRIGSIISPTATFASSDSRGSKMAAVIITRHKVMNVLSTLSRWGRIIGRKNIVVNAGRLNLDYIDITHSTACATNH